MSRTQSAGRCPVCRARFRGTRICSRCGADLSPSMHLAAEAYRLRRDAREAISAGDFQAGRELSRRAQELCATEAGRELFLLGAVLSGKTRSD